MNWESLKDYQPQKITDKGGFEPFKAKGTCAVMESRIEEKHTEKYDGDMVRIIYEVIDHPEFSGRRLGYDKSPYFLENEDSLKKLADLMFTCGLTFKNKAELDLVLEKFSGMLLHFSAWPAKKRALVDGKWVTAEPEELVQQFKILGEAGDEPVTAKSF